MKTARFKIKVRHKDGTYSYLCAGYDLELTESKANSVINAMIKQEAFIGAVFSLERVY